MKAHLAQGLAAAEAARLAERAAAGDAHTGSMEVMRADLRRALEAFDEARGHSVLGAAFDSFSVDGVISDLLIPYLDDLGERWSRDEVTVAQEHFASNLIRARMLALGRSRDAGYRPRAVLACPEGELHDLGIVLFGVALGPSGVAHHIPRRQHPLATVISTARKVRPDAVVIAATDRSRLAGAEGDLATRARSYRRFLAGRASDGIAAGVGAEHFDTDPVSAAEHPRGHPFSNPLTGGYRREGSRRLPSGGEPVHRHRTWA